MNQPFSSPKVLLAFGLFAVFGTSACTTVRVESQPPGAQVVWSPDGLEPFRSWPPNSWEFRSESTGSTTPLLSRGAFWDTVYVTVEKEGYRRPLPQIAQLYTWRREKLVFEMQELPETRAARLRSEGYVQYDGQWVDPAALGLVEYEGTWLPSTEATRRQNLAQGLVEYNGQWLKPDEAQRQLAQDMQRQGYVEYNGRWLPPTEATQQREIDEAVAAIRATKQFSDLPSPRVLGRATHEDAQVEIYNTAREPISVLFSGPMSRRFELQPEGDAGARADDRIVLPPGRYDIVILRDGSEEPLWGNWPLNAGMEYSINHRESLGHREN